MPLTEYERTVRRDIEAWQHAEPSVLAQAMNWAMKPVDWAVDQVAPAALTDKAGDVVEGLLNVLNDASQWTYDPNAALKALREQGIAVETIADLRTIPLDALDAYAKSLVQENAVLAALEGAGTGLGGAVLIMADIPLLFGINLRLIQQIAAAYGFPMQGPEFRPLVLSIWNVAASGSREAKNEALREISVAAAALSRDMPYRGRVSGTLRDQNRHLPREIAKTLVSRKIFQTIPIAGAAVGAGVNYWFTSEAAETAFMLMRALFIEAKERA